MKKSVVALFGFFVASAACGGEWLPRKHAFAPFIADPTQPAYVVRLTGPVGGGRRAEINMGDEFSAYSFSTADGADIRLGIMGGVAGRFNISRVTNDFEIADFSLAFPVDYIKGPWAYRAMYWHTSSHIGDDYIKSHSLGSASLEKNVTDEARFYASYSGLDRLRLYAGASYAFNLIPASNRRGRAHCGIEAVSSAKPRHGFIALDLQSLERLGWRPSFTARTGYRAEKENSAFTIFVEFFSGMQPYLGFMRQQETHWSLGVGFAM